MDYRLFNMVVGFIIIIVFWVWRYYTRRKNPTIKSAFTNTLHVDNLIIFFCNIVLVAIGTAISIHATLYDTGTITMSTNEISLYSSALSALIGLVWVIVGLILGCLVIFIFEFIKSVVNSIKLKKESAIRQIAHHIWESEGCPNGHDLEHWIKAENIWKAQKKRINQVSNLK